MRRAIWLRRFLGRALVALLLGLGTTVAVAWVFSATAEFSGGRGGSGDHALSDPPDRVHYVVYSQFISSAGLTRRTWFYHIPTALQFGDPFLPIDYSQPGEAPSTLRWGCWPEVVKGFDHWTSNDAAWPTPPGEAVVEECAGWPWRALWWSAPWKSAGPIGPPLPPDTSSGIALPTLAGRWDATAVRALPLVPIWSGLAADTLVYAVVWCGVWFGVGAIRRRYRRGRGLCPGCAYDLRGLTEGPCPECGRRRQ